MEATTHRDNRFSLGFTAGKSASADALPVVAARGFSLEGDMCMAELAVMWPEDEPQPIETRREELRREKRRIEMAIEAEKQALADINDQLVDVYYEERRR